MSRPDALKAVRVILQSLWNLEWGRSGGEMAGYEGYLDLLAWKAGMRFEVVDHKVKVSWLPEYGGKKS